MVIYKKSWHLEIRHRHFICKTVDLNFEFYKFQKLKPSFSIVVAFLEARNKDRKEELS